MGAAASSREGRTKEGREEEDREDREEALSLSFSSCSSSTTALAPSLRHAATNSAWNWPGGARTPVAIALSIRPTPACRARAG